MATECTIQRDLVVPFFTDPVKGLGYKEISANTIGNNLIIESEIEQLLFKDVNARHSNAVMRQHYQGDRDAFVAAFIEAARARLLKSANVAIFLRQTFRFHEHSFHLFFPSTSVTQPEQFELNQFVVVQELPYKYPDIQFSRRPDLCFFVNGFFFGYCELKHISMGQTAKKEGREKIISNYVEAVRNSLDHNEQKDILKLFESGVHLTASDLGETYLLRQPEQFRGRIEGAIKNGSHRELESIKDDIRKAFKQVPCEQPNTSEQALMETVFRNLYSKEAIEHEILYFNFLSYGKSRSGKLFSPRPKQKYGVDKTMERVKTLYQNLGNPEFLIDEFRSKLIDLPQSVQEAELTIRRDMLLNNQNIYSILLQYSAGFGKTNIMCWLALRLKDLQCRQIELKSATPYVFDKVLLVTDRIGLRGQVTHTLANMNVDKNLVAEANDATFTDLLLDPKKRIITINVQKFNFVESKLTRKQRKLLASLRIAFVIDEIHRSHSGLQNERMVNLFDQLSNKLSDEIKAENKDLLIGLTATPSDNVLQRYGEPSGYGPNGMIWTPLDCFSMKDAIHEGFVLPVVQHVIPVDMSLYYAEDDYDPEYFRLPNKNEIYAHPERIAIAAKYIASVVRNNTFKQIRGNGKAMLACHSIDAAIQYFHALTSELGDDGKVFIVYSGGRQDIESADKLNGMNEDKTVEAFKTYGVNGIMIVVDKLQTGFDEPYLHTLFLDKEVSGINAVQTACRVNRTCKFKHNCLIVDMSIDNVNVKAIQDAFAQYENITTKAFNAQQAADSLHTLHQKLNNHEIKRTLFKDYLKAFSDSENDLALTDKINALDQEKVDQYLSLAREYLMLFQNVYGVIKTDPELKKDGRLIGFVDRIKRARLRAPTRGVDKAVVDFEFVDNIGPWEIVITPKEASKPRETKGASDKIQEKSEIDLMNEILKRNEREQMKEAELEAHKDRVFLLFKLIDESQSGSRIKAKIIKRILNEDELFNEFKKTVKSIFRSKIGKEYFSDDFKLIFFEMINSYIADYKERCL
jgi:type I restriction enzyme R subunit